jgi:hypothetical protein
MKKTASLAFVALGLAALVAAGCSGSGTAVGTTPTAAPSALPTGQCTLPPGESVQQVFPQSGASAAPNLQGVVFAVAPNPLPTSWYFYVTHVVAGATLTTFGTAQIGFLATPTPSPTASPGASPLPSGTPLPTPSDTPSPAIFGANPLYEIASIGNFANATTFTTYLANTGCGIGIQESTFTTNVIDQPSPTPTPSPTASAT